MGLFTYKAYLVCTNCGFVAETKVRKGMTLPEEPVRCRNCRTTNACYSSSPRGWNLPAEQGLLAGDEEEEDSLF